MTLDSKYLSSPFSHSFPRTVSSTHLVIMITISFTNRTILSSHDISGCNLKIWVKKILCWLTGPWCFGLKPKLRQEKLSKNPTLDFSYSASCEIPAKIPMSFGHVFKAQQLTGFPIYNWVRFHPPLFSPKQPGARFFNTQLVGLLVSHPNFLLYLHPLQHRHLHGSFLRTFFHALGFCEHRTQWFTLGLPENPSGKRLEGPIGKWWLWWIPFKKMAIFGINSLNFWGVDFEGQKLEVA